MFCSLECRDDVYERCLNLDSMMASSHPYFTMEKILFDADKAFGGREKLLKFIEENDVTKMEKTFFDYDLSDPRDPSYKENLIKSVLSLNSAANEATREMFAEKARVCSGGNPLIEIFLTHLGLIYSENGDIRNCMQREDGPSDEERTEAYLFGRFSDFLNHSCEPNVNATNGRDADSFIYCCKPIKAGHQLFLNYL